MPKNCDAITVFLCYGQFEATRKPDSWRIVCKTYVSINSFTLQKLKQNQKISNTGLTVLLWVKVLFLSRNVDFLQRNADISKIKRALLLKGILPEATYVCVHTCQIWSL